MLKKKILMMSSAVLVTFALQSGTAYASSTGIVNCSGYLNIRQSAGTGSKILGKLYPGTRVTLEDSSNGWYKINYDGINGWVSSAYISEELPALSDRGGSASDSADESIVSGKDQEIIEYAQKYIGVRYVYGGSSEKGFDCSGLTQYVFRKAGISINRTASSQARQGIKIEKSDLKPGDLVFFDTNGGRNSISHVGIYMGNDKFIHAESGSIRKVTISSLKESYYSRNYMTARRVLD